MCDFLLWKNAKSMFYMASIAATWIWTPAIFVSSEKAYYSGLGGFLLFLIPNILTLMLFAYFASVVRCKADGFTLTDAIKGAGKGQQRLHLAVSCTILICSTCVQLMGLHTLFVAWGDIPKWLSALTVSVMALAMVWRDGIKGSILADYNKYFLMLFGGLILLAAVLADGGSLNIMGRKPIPFMELLGAFGIPTIIGLLSAPYVDQTFWQRVFSIDKDKIKSTFIGSALMFGIIPAVFGLIGFCSVGGTEWTIATAFQSFPLKVILAVCVLCALISTLDSNLCAFSSIVYADMKQSISIGRLSMIALLIVASAVMIMTNLGITDMFLIYGTIRTCVALPTILIILNRYNPQRLLYSTILSVTVAPLGFIASGGNWIFTVLALIIPVFGYDRR